MGRVCGPSLPEAAELLQSASGQIQDGGRRRYWKNLNRNKLRII